MNEQNEHPDGGRTQTEEDFEENSKARLSSKLRSLD